MADAVELVLGGLALQAWESVRISRSLEAGAGVFELSVSERFPGEAAARIIRPGQSCEVRIDGERLIKGYVDEVEVSLDPTSHGISVRGRDAAADLIDCAPDLDPTTSPAQWSNVSLLELAARLAAPFGIRVSSDVDLGARFEHVAISAGQRAWEVIEQQARYRQVLVISDGQGGIKFTRASRARLASAVVEGKNMLRGSATYSHADRFSHYIVKGQAPAWAGLGGPNAGRALGTARDKLIKRHRPLLLVADQAVDSARCTQRAQWEATSRAARGDRAEVEVQGWRQVNGQLWPLNALVPLHSPTLGLSGEFLTGAVTFTLDPGAGTVTALELMRPDAFTTEPEPEPKPFGFVLPGEEKIAAATAAAGDGSAED